MTDRIDELSDRARWFLEQFNEIDLASICAAEETAKQEARAAVKQAREVLAFAEKVAATSGPGPAGAVQAVIDRLRSALDGPADTIVDIPADKNGPAIPNRQVNEG